jgi:leucyl-tRNA synthetase
MSLPERYEFQEIERKWQERWKEANLFHAQPDPDRPKFYGLEFFPYPSGSGLSVGHFKNYAPVDAYLRYKSMCGYNVMHPMGWDAFGQPAENEAIKRELNPREMVREFAATYKKQFDLIGLSYDWDREINSSDPSYYRWTQWLFLLLYRKGLAYRKNAPVNWCPKDKTVLANEEVVNGRCWRCDTLVEKRQMPQWFFKITAYADRLLNDLDGLNWPEGIRSMQRNWIGRSEGVEVDFVVEGRGDKLRVFTTRPDTLWGATFMVLAPEHPLVKEITTPEQLADMDAYIQRAQTMSEIDRQAEGKEKTGVWTGANAINPVNGQLVPIWIADYVMIGYGTGAIMAVPAHDQRDFDFAKKFALPIVQVIDGGVSIENEAYAGEGVLVNSGQLTGRSGGKEAAKDVAKWLQEIGLGEAVVTFKLRDWLISRQRYWGAPIPIIHCPVHGEVPVPDNELPVRLPDVANYKPSGTGESPLATISEFVNTTCPICGHPARRETDTMGGFACSSWYFLRFADPHNEMEPFSRKAVDYWLPVDMYVGGAEHAVMHLLYARFWTKVLYDAGLVGFTEPFTTLRNQGMMLARTPGRKLANGEDREETDGEPIEDWKVLRPEELASFPKDEIVYRWVKMSKSLRNVVTPDETAEKYGADALRVYEMFVAPFEETVQWSEDGIRGSANFLGRVYRLAAQYADGYSAIGWRLKLEDPITEAERNLRRKTHQTVARVAADLEAFRFNTSVAALMSWVNLMYEVSNALPRGARSAALDEALDYLVHVISPFAPHLADELWEAFDCGGYLYRHPWPEIDPEVAKEDEITLIVQINGKVRDKLTVPADSDNNRIIEIALSSQRIIDLLAGATPKKVIAVPGKLVNIVI